MFHDGVLALLVVTRDEDLGRPAVEAGGGREPAAPTATPASSEAGIVVGAARSAPRAAETASSASARGEGGGELAGPGGFQAEKVDLLLELDGLLGAVLLGLEQFQLGVQQLFLKLELWKKLCSAIEMTLCVNGSVSVHLDFNHHSAECSCCY